MEKQAVDTGLDGIFLDLYGTLTDGDRLAVEGVCADVIRDHALDLTPLQLAAAWGTRFLHSLDEHNRDAFVNLHDLEIKTLTAVMADHGVRIEPHPYVRKLEAYWLNPPLHAEALQFLQTFHLPICIVSNADRCHAESALALHGICVAAVVTSEEARSYKPDGGIFELALRRTGWRRDRVLHVGDSLHSDVGGAIAAGLRSGWINRAGRIHDVGTHQPDHEFPDLLALAAFISNTGSPATEIAGKALRHTG